MWARTQLQGRGHGRGVGQCDTDAGEGLILGSGMHAHAHSFALARCSDWLEDAFTARAKALFFAPQERHRMQGHEGERCGLSRLRVIQQVC